MFILMSVQIKSVRFKLKSVEIFFQNYSTANSCLGYVNFLNFSQLQFQISITGFGLNYIIGSTKNVLFYNLNILSITLWHDQFLDLRLPPSFTSSGLLFTSTSCKSYIEM